MSTWISESLATRNGDYRWLYHVWTRIGVVKLEIADIKLVQSKHGHIVKAPLSGTKQKRNDEQNDQFFASSKLCDKQPELFPTFRSDLLYMRYSII